MKNVNEVSIEDVCEALYAAGLPCTVKNVATLRRSWSGSPDADPMTFMDERPDGFLDWDGYLSRTVEHLGYSVPEGLAEDLFEQMQFKMADRGLLDVIVDDRTMVQIVEESREELGM